MQPMPVQYNPTHTHLEHIEEVPVLYAEGVGHLCRHSPCLARLTNHLQRVELWHTHTQHNARTTYHITATGSGRAACVVLGSGLGLYET